MRILFADKFPSSHLGEVEAMGHECVLDPDLSAEGLPAKIGSVDALIVRSTKVTADALDAANGLRLIIRAGAGTNTIDKQRAAEKGVYVCNVPGKNAIAVAELTLGLILAIDRNIPDNVIDIRQCKWDKKRYSSAQGLYGRRLGIVGTGAIGLAVAERARGFGIDIRIIRKTDRPAETTAKLDDLGVTYADDLETLARCSDILSFHVPAADSTRGLVNEALLDLLPPGAMIINTSRGDLVDESALIHAMDRKGIRAGVDVYQGEPTDGQAPFDSKLARHPNVYGTHHIGASTSQAQAAVADGVLDILKSFGMGEILHCVNGVA